MTLIGPLGLGMVQPWDCDVMGHFTVRRYAAAFDDASYQFLHQATGERPVAPDGRLGWADVRQVYEYVAEMAPGDLFEIMARPVKLGRSSLTVEYLLRRRDGGEVCARMTSTLVRFDLEARASTPIAGEMRQRIAALVDQSGTPAG